MLKRSFLLLLPGIVVLLVCQSIVSSMGYGFDVVETFHWDWKKSSQEVQRWVASAVEKVEVARYGRCVEKKMININGADYPFQPNHTYMIDGKEYNVGDYVPGCAGSPPVEGIETFSYE